MRREVRSALLAPAQIPQKEPPRPGTLIKPVPNPPSLLPLGCLTAVKGPPQLGAQAQVAGILVLGAPEDRLNSFQGQLPPLNMSGVTHLPVSLSTMSPPSGSLGRQRYDRSRTQISSLTDWGGFGVRAQVLQPLDFRQDETEGRRGPVPCPNTTVHWWQRWD